MAVQPLPEIQPDEEKQLLERARGGDDGAFSRLVEPWRGPLFGYVYRMVTHPQDAEDLTQDTLTRAFESLGEFEGRSRFKSWLFGIATHACLDHLRQRKRWRVEAQVDGEKRADADPEAQAAIGALMSQPDFTFEIREHIAFCFSCVARTLEPEAQAALMLREVLGFSAREAAAILDVTDSVFRHRLEAARSHMQKSYEGLCALVNKSGICYQCKGLRDFAPERNRGEDMTRIRVAPGRGITPESLLDARIDVVRDADLEGGRSRALHDAFFLGLGAHEEGREH